MDVCLLDDDFFRDGVWGIFAPEDCWLVVAIDFQAWKQKQQVKMQQFLDHFFNLWPTFRQRPRGSSSMIPRSPPS